MFSLEKVQWIIHDIFATELVKQRRDTFAFFDKSQEMNFDQIPLGVFNQAVRQVEIFFSFKAVPFKTLNELATQAYNAYQKNHFVYLSTSGTTGTPKQIRYTQEMMEIEGRSVGNYFKDAHRFITLTPRHHLYGFSFAVFFPFVLKVPTISLAPLPIQPWNKLLKKGDLIAGFPLFWEYFLKANNTFPPGITVEISTAPCPKGLFNRLKQAGAERVIEVYGATDTGGIGVREDEDAPFIINDFFELDTTHSPIQIRRKGIDTWLTFPDEIKFVPPRGIYPLKRFDRVVQVAGVNVSLEHVETVLKQHPAVNKCVVRLMRQDEGNRLKTFIVLNPSFTESILADLRKYLVHHLSSHEMPRSFTFGLTLPKNTMGKDADW